MPKKYGDSVIPSLPSDFSHVLENKTMACHNILTLSTSFSDHLKSVLGQYCIKRSNRSAFPSLHIYNDTKPTNRSRPGPWTSEFCFFCGCTKLRQIRSLSGSKAPYAIYVVSRTLPVILTAVNGCPKS